MNKESFLETIKHQYAEEIRAAYIEHEHGLGGKVDFPALNKRLQKLMSTAKVEGLPVADFEDLVHANLPEEVAHDVELTATRKAA